MAVAGPGVDDTASALAGALADVARIVPYLRATSMVITDVKDSSRVPDDGTMMSSAELIDDPEWLKLIITSTGHVLGTDDLTVATSLFIQSYSYRVLALAIACATTSGVVPNSSASAMAIGLKSGRVSYLGYTTADALVLAEPHVDLAVALREPSRLSALLVYLERHAFDGHLVPLIDATRSTVRIGERLLWGNVAASLAIAFRTMEGCLGAWVQDLGTYVEQHAAPRLHGLGSYLVLEQDDRHGWFWERTNCCLYDRLPGNIRCSDCSRTPVALRRAAYRASLNPS